MLFMLVVMAMIMTMVSSHFFSRPNRLWFERGKPSGIGILFRHFNKYHDHCLRIDLKFAATSQCVGLQRFQLDFGFAASFTLLNVCRTFCAGGVYLIIRMISDIQYEFSILGKKLQVIRACRTNLSTMWRGHRIQRLVGMRPNGLRYYQSRKQHSGIHRSIHFLSSKKPQASRERARVIIVRYFTLEKSAAILASLPS